MNWTNRFPFFKPQTRPRRSPHKGVPDACECEWRPYFHMEGAQPTNEERLLLRTYNNPQIEIDMNI